MPLAALPALSAATLALAASAAPLSPVAAAGTAAGRQPRARPHGHRGDRPGRAARGDLRGRACRRYRVEWHDAVRRGRSASAGRAARSCASRSRARSASRRPAPCGRARLAAAIAGAHASAEVARSDRPLPAPGGRVRLPGDSIVYSYRPPYGMQVHPLGTIGKLNALATTCTDAGRRRGWRCRRAALLAAADRLVEVSVPAGADPPLRVPVRLRRRAPRLGVGDDPGDGRPGARAHRGHQRRAALRRVGPRRLPGAHPPRAARRRRHGRRRPDRPLRHVLVPAADARAQRRGAVAHRRGRLRPHHGRPRSPPGSPAAARASSPRTSGDFDTGAWTLYDLGGAEADLNYHRLAARFAQGVCTRALARGFCPAAARFARYTSSRRSWPGSPAKVRAPRRVTIALGDVEADDAHLVVRDRRGSVVADRRLVLERTIVRLVRAAARAPGPTRSRSTRTAINGRAAQRAVTLSRPRRRRSRSRSTSRSRAEARGPRRRRREAARRPQRGRSGLGEAHEARVVALGRGIAVRLVLRARLRVGGARGAGRAPRARPPARRRPRAARRGRPRRGSRPRSRAGRRRGGRTGRRAGARAGGRPARPRAGRSPGRPASPPITGRSSAGDVRDALGERGALLLGRAQRGDPAGEAARRRALRLEQRAQREQVVAQRLGRDRRARSPSRSAAAPTRSRRCAACGGR